MKNGSTGILTREKTQKISGGCAPGPLPQLARRRKRHLARALPTGGLASLVHYYQAVLPPQYVLHPGLMVPLWHVDGTLVVHRTK